MTKNHKFGFTLAEVLITLGIIGIVSTLTLPTLVNNYQSKVRIAQLQKVYNEISNAAVSAIADERADTLDYTYIYESIDGAIKFLKKYIKVSKECTVSECMASAYKSLDGTKSADASEIFPDNTQCVALNSGAVVCILRSSGRDGYNYHGEISFIVDVNGKTSPNTNGRDLFQFDMYSDGTIGTSYKINDYANSGEHCKSWAETAGYGGSCFAKVVADGWKMDY